MGGISEQLAERQVIPVSRKWISVHNRLISLRDDAVVPVDVRHSTDRSDAHDRTRSCEVHR